ncbi:MAG: FG-GAP repeat protein [Magnetococcales bacterium]|nr:FG-GAP repeat protein [Magnetococcales bacterium]
MTAGDHSGRSVCSAGDVNGDGFADLIIGAYQASPGSLQGAGSSYVVFGKASGFSSVIDLSSLDGGSGFRLDGAAAGDWSGYSVSSAGDVNGDGFADLIVGARLADPNALADAGSSYVVFGKASGFNAVLALSSLTGSDGFRLDGVASLDNSGYSVSSAGDFNGDGFADLLVGAYGPNAFQGAGYLLFGKASGFASAITLSGLTGSDGFRLDGAAAGDQGSYNAASIDVHSAGDVNGDGFADLIIGAYKADPDGLVDAGSSYVVFGFASGLGSAYNPANLDGSTGFRLDGDAANGYSGARVSSAGDINGDGFDDVIVGAKGVADAGFSGVLFGKAAGFGSVINLSSLNGATGFRLLGDAGDLAGIVGSAGDVNGDGFADLLVGAPLLGSSYVVFGHASGFSSVIHLSTIHGSSGFRLDDLSSGSHAGAAVSAAGDVNGDGFSDLIIGAPQADPHGVLDAGSSYVLFGSNVTGAVTFLGGSNADTLTGTAAEERFVAGGGDDALIGGGGADLFHGGAGNDTITVADLTFRWVDGGSGTDTLALSGAGMHLNLTTLRGRIDSMEVIHLTGSGDNSLTLTALDLLNLSDTSNLLTIEGNAGDIVRGGTGWTDGGISGGYHLYSKDAAQLRVATAATFCQGDPLVLDLNGDGIHLTAKEAGSRFDMDGNGVADSTGWIGAGDGLLVWDRSGNGRIDDMREVISEQFAPQATSSLSALASLDDNRDGLFDGNDVHFAHLQIWRDDNQDGVSIPQELYTLSQWGITALGLTADRSAPSTANGNTMTGFASVYYGDGRQGSMAEVQLDFEPADTVATRATEEGLPPMEHGEGLLTGSAPFPMLPLWDGATVPQEESTLEWVEEAFSLEPTALLADQIAQSVERVDGRAGTDGRLNIQEILDFSGSHPPCMATGDDADVVNLQAAMDTLLRSTAAVAVDTVNPATDLADQTDASYDGYVLHTALDSLHALLADTEVVLNLMR